MLVTALMVAFATLHEGDGFSTDCTARATEDVVLHVDHYIVEGKGFAISTSVCLISSSVVPIVQEIDDRTCPVLSNVFSNAQCRIDRYRSRLHSRPPFISSGSGTNHSHAKPIS